jgi:hypothetical protein
MPNVLIIPNFIDSIFCESMNFWVDTGVKNKWLDNGRSINNNWSYNKRLTTRIYGDRFDYDNVIYDVQRKITRYLDLHHLEKSIIGGGKNGIVVSCTYNGGDVYEHQDPMEGENHVLRCNIMTRKAESGAELFIDGKKININVGDLHCYLPSNVKHYVTESQGETSRVMWMFGYQCSIEEFNTIQNRIKNENSSLCN